MLKLNSLLEYWNPLVERCGLVLEDESILELPNTHEHPENNFRFPVSVFEQHLNCLATWHTHAHGSPNLSVEDYFTFLKYPQYFHYIVGKEKVWGFYVENNTVLLYEDDNL